MSATGQVSFARYPSWTLENIFTKASKLNEHITLNDFFIATNQNVQKNMLQLGALKKNLDQSESQTDSMAHNRYLYSGIL